jgi:hypothetical protein
MVKLGSVLAHKRPNIRFMIGGFITCAIANSSISPGIADIRAESSPFPGARRVPGAQIWHVSDSHDIDDYLWLDNEHFLASEGHPGNTMKALELDSKSGHRWPVTHLGSGLVDDKITHHNMLYPVCVSPNGRWLLGFFDAVPVPE